MSDSLQPHVLPTRLLHPWDFPGKNTRVGCHFLLQEIFLTQGLSLGLSHCRHTLSSEPPGKFSSVTGISGKNQTKPCLNHGLLLEQSSKFLCTSVSFHSKFLSNWLTPSSPNLTRLSFVKHFFIHHVQTHFMFCFVLFCFARV